MKASEEFRHKYNSLKDDLVTEIWSLILSSGGEDEDVKELDIREKRGCPAVVTQVIDDQQSEVIHTLLVKEDSVIAVAGIYEDDNEYDIDEFEIPMLLIILESVEKHIE
jgi:hypothetical protein